MTIPKLSRTQVALLVLALVMVLGTYLIIDIEGRHGPSTAIYAERLEEKPETYIFIDNSDPCLLQAVSNPETIVELGEGAQIVQMIHDYGTSNILFNGNYYHVGIIVGDNFPSATEYLLLWLSLAALVLSGILLIAICAVNVARRLQSR